MNVLVRGIDPVAIKKIDELAKKKNISRSEYLRQMIEAAAVLEAVADTGDKYEKLVQAVLQVIIDNTETLEYVKMFFENGD